MQQTLFDTGTPAKHLARRDDPETSKESASEVAKEPGPRQQFALKCVTEFPGHTRMELATQFDLDSCTIGRRLRELERMGKIREGESRKCTKSGFKAATWWPVEVDDGSRR